MILKAFAGRPRDWLDVESVLYRQGDKLDWSLVEGELRPLLELRESLEPLEELRRLRGRVLKEP